jgi:hypothetical protein
MSKKDEKRNIHNEKGQYFEHVDVRKGDFVNGDKTDRSIHARDVDGSVLNTGDNATINMHTPTENVTKADIQGLLNELQNALQAAPVDEDVKESLQSDIQTVKTQLEKPEPKKALLLPRARAIMDTITATAAAYEAWPTIVEMGTRLVDWVKALF